MIKQNEYEIKEAGKLFKVLKKKHSKVEGYFKTVSQCIPAVIGIKCMMGKEIRFVCWQQNTKAQYIHSHGDFL